VKQYGEVRANLLGLEISCNLTSESETAAKISKGACRDWTVVKNQKG